MNSKPSRHRNVTTATVPSPALPTFLRFGIEGLDELISGSIDPETQGICIPKDNNGFGTVSVCIIGPDGTGKSILAMHLSAWYASHISQLSSTGSVATPCILYVSTDLKYEKALRIWDAFGLQKGPDRNATSLPGSFELKRRTPFARDNNPNTREPSLAEYLEKSDTKQAGTSDVPVTFVDLASDTAGDDWTFLNRVLAALHEPKANEPCHLMVIDAVEGLEMMVGDVDAFGERRSRRSRIAQIMRAAGMKCHIVLVVEEGAAGARQPEQFVSDVVVRLRVTEMALAGRSYARRTVEIEKARAQAHVRGQHVIAIRDGNGSYSDDAKKSPNLDDPRVDHPCHRTTGGTMPPPRAYMQVFHSLHYRNRKPNLHTSPSGVPHGESQGIYAGFGIPHLDDMLAGESVETPIGAQAFTAHGRDKENAHPRRPERSKSGDRCGLPAGSITALVGGNGTNKRTLALAYLAQCFKEEPIDEVPILILFDAWSRSDVVAGIKAQVSDTALAAEVEKRLVYRRLVAQDTPSAMLLHIVRKTIDEAKRLHAVPPDEAWRVRVVIGNLTTMRGAFPDMDQDPLFLPSLIFLLRNEAITALLVATETDDPAGSRHTPFLQELRSLVDHHLYTWHVPFFGEDRVAIAAVPPITPERPAVVRELRCLSANGSKERLQLFVDPHFEMYTGLLEHTQPQLVPLRVRLFGHGEGFDAYRRDLNDTFRQLFSLSDTTDELVGAFNTAQYESLRSASYLQGGTRLDHTFVFQVDEFWSERNKGLLNLERYLKADTVKEGQTDEANDPYRFFQFTAGDQDRGSSRQRIQFFQSMDFVPPKYSQRPALQLDRVPYMWDFGFMLMRRRPWEAAEDRRFVRDYVKLRRSNNAGNNASERAARQANEIEEGAETTVQAIFNKLKHVRRRPRSEEEKFQLRRKQCLAQHEAGHAPVTWREFLHACTIVAEHSTNEGGRPYPFDLDLMAPESFSALVLEIWGSELDAAGVNDKFKFTRYRYGGEGPGILELLKAAVDWQGASDDEKACLVSFYRTWLLLGEVLTPEQIGVERGTFTSHIASATSIASRQWYSTASAFLEGRGVADPFLPVRLPGSRSVRGDWFLAISRGSRSPRLGHRVVDVLSSRRSNVQRLHAGLGLPTRRFAEKSAMSKAWTRLYTVCETGTKMWVPYGDLCDLGSCDESSDNPKGTSTPPFHWIWRSTIRQYDQHTRVWLNLLLHLLIKWRTFLSKDNDSVAWKTCKSWHHGFELYDLIPKQAKSETHDGIQVTKDCFDAAEESDKAPLPSFEMFKRECSGWLNAIQHATVAQNADNPR